MMNPFGPTGPGFQPKPSGPFGGPLSGTAPPSRPRPSWVVGKKNPKPAGSPFPAWARRPLHILSQGPQPGPGYRKPGATIYRRRKRAKGSKNPGVFHNTTQGPQKRRLRKHGPGWSPKRLQSALEERYCAPGSHPGYRRTRPLKAIAPPPPNDPGRTTPAP